MLTYRTDLAYRPPISPAMEGEAVAKMKSYAPAGGEDSFNASLNLAAYKRAAEDANMAYSRKHLDGQRQLALSGLTGMAQQQGMASSLLGGLFG